MSKTTIAFWSVFLLFVGYQFALANERDVAMVPQSLVEDYGGDGVGIAPSKKIREILPIALDMIKHFEGWEPRAYNDAAGYCTIGYGHLIALKRCEDVDLGEFGSEMTLADGAKLLEVDTLSARLAVQRLVTADLNDEQFGALAVFAYNVGKEPFKGSTLLALVNEAEFEKASRQFGRWVNAGGVTLEGLVIRRACEATLFVGGLQYDKNGRFSRAECQSFGVAATSNGPIDVLVGE